VVREYGEVGRVRGHAGQLNQVFVNLLANAAQAVAGRDDGTVWVTTRERDDQVLIELRDNGPGIPPEVLPRIFDPFFTTKDAVHGVGLGPFVAEGVVRGLGGRIVAANRDGRGARFSVELPVAEHRS
jgi:C4-dicarboxylate-specific signal transduction histidine kinase